MAPVNYGRVLFNEIPKGYPEPGKTTIYDTSKTIDLDNEPLNGGFLLKNLYLSPDPFLRGKMRSPEIKSYSDAYVIGEPIYGYGIAKVLRSEYEGVKVGDYIYGAINFEEYTIRKDLDSLSILTGKNKFDLPWRLFIGVIGMPGKTAYTAWKEFSKAKKGETAFVSTGAGPVGSLVIQLAKRDGLKVIGSAGSAEKVAFMKSIGADVAFNYKEQDTSEVLQKEGPIDIYWDNVGGETLDAALVAANRFARFIECGMIASYNSDPQPIRNARFIIGKSITIQGFIVNHGLEQKYDDEFYEIIPELIKNGEIKYSEELLEGLEVTGEAILNVQKGLNKAKVVIQVHKDD